MEMRFLDTLAVVPLRVGQSEETLFEELAIAASAEVNLISELDETRTLSHSRS